MKKLILLITFAFSSIVSMAQTQFYVDGLTYEILSESDKTVEVLFGYDLNGEISIPTIVSYEGKNYTVTSIGDAAFSGNLGLTSVFIPNSVISIGDFAFSGCSGLTFVMIPNSVASIGDSAFNGCDGLTSVNIPNSVSSIGKQVFDRCDRLTMINVDSRNNYYKSIDGVLFNSDATTLIQYPIGNSRLVYSIPNSVTFIGDWAFNNCTVLTSITIPNSVVSIGDYAFSGCAELASVTIPNSVTTIGNSTFLNCLGLTSIFIPNSVTSIGGAVFSGCDGLTTINVDDENKYYKSIDGVLFNFDATTLVQYPIGNSRTTYIIPNSVASIGGSAFNGCDSLISVTIPNSVTTIGDGVFSSCTGLTSVVIPNSVTFIGMWVFSQCSGLTSIAIPNSVVSIGDATFSGCTGLTSVVIPNSVTVIGNSAFSSCSGLTSITIPNSVTSLGSWVFSRCSGLTSVTVPSSVCSISNYAFSDCVGLQEFVNFAEEPQQITSDVFNNVQLENVQLSVPSSSVEKYKNADVWKDFGTIEGQDAGVGTVETDKIVVSGGVLRNPEGEDIRIYDLNGREMYSGNGSELRLPTGFYILQTVNGSRKVVF